ncbi:MAG TPA: VanZ family protein [Holophagaceae bacterium]|nr:VanZ family protein [Holophagaceae bacterium]
MKTFLRLLPALALASLIAVLSHQSQLPGGISLPSPLDKVVHAAVYAALAFLLDWGLQARTDWPVYRRHGLVFLLLAAYGASDEWHQSFVPGRDASALDWLADVVGTLVGLGAASLPMLGSRRLGAFGWHRGALARRDPARPLILVADPHWRDESFPGLREAAAARPDADWLFLGDVFDVWVGIPAMETQAQAAFLTWVDGRRAAGAWVGLWLGNREYFLDRHAGRFDLLGEGTGGRLAGEGLAFEHGDLINASDRAYRTWNLLSRSGLLWAAFRLLPGPWAHGLATAIERRLRTTNREYKLAFPEAAFGEAARAVAPATFLTGHFHTEQRVANGLALPWAFEGRFWVWERGEAKPFNL